VRHPRQRGVGDQRRAFAALEPFRGALEDAEVERASALGLG